MTSIVIHILKTWLLSYLEFLSFGHYSDFEWIFCLKHRMEVFSLLPLPSAQTTVHHYLALVSPGIEMISYVIIWSGSIHEVNCKPANLIIQINVTFSLHICIEIHEEVLDEPLGGWFHFSMKLKDVATLQA